MINTHARIKFSSGAARVATHPGEGRHERARTARKSHTRVCQHRQPACAGSISISGRQEPASVDATIKPPLHTPDAQPANPSCTVPYCHAIAHAYNALTNVLQQLHMEHRNTSDYFMQAGMCSWQLVQQQLARFSQSCALA